MKNNKKFKIAGECTDTQFYNYSKKDFAVLLCCEGYTLYCTTTILHITRTHTHLNIHVPSIQTSSHFSIVRKTVLMAANGQPVCVKFRHLFRWK